MKFLLIAGTALRAMTMTAMAADKASVVSTYSDIAEAGYGDSLITARTLQSAVEALITSPSVEGLSAAKAAWLAARVPYQQTEVFRFGNPIVDDWEGKVNAWPLDEGLIDYVDVSYGGPTDENEFAALNVIANPTLSIGGVDVDATNITSALLEGTLHEADGIEANVATGYHAIEFLLWGQDLNGHGPGAGARSWTDYALGANCTNGNCDRRGDYLKAAVDLLVSDLEWMTARWGENGSARNAITSNPDAGVIAMVTGMGSLSYGEQAGERMRLGLMLNDPEEEHDCFSDNTHNSHFYDGLGVCNVYNGSYTRIDGSVISGPSLADMVQQSDVGLAAELSGKLDTSVLALGRIKTAAQAGFA